MVLGTVSVRVLPEKQNQKDIREREVDLLQGLRVGLPRLVENPQGRL